MFRYIQGMPEVKNRQIVFVKTTFDNTATFTKNFQLTFAPDDMIVRSVTCGGGLGTVNTINMKGVGDLFHFTGEETQAPKLIFNLTGRSVAGEQVFTILDVDSGLNTVLNNTLIFVLEFIEFVR